MPADNAAAFKDDWPAPDEDSIEYLKTVDLRTLQPRELAFIPLPLDLLGQPLPQGASGRLCYSWGVARVAVSADGQRVATAGPACSDRSVELFDAGSGRLIRRLAAFRGMAKLVFAADDEKIVTLIQPPCNSHIVVRVQGVPPLQPRDRILRGRHAHHEGPISRLLGMDCEAVVDRRVGRHDDRTGADGTTL